MTEPIDNRNIDDHVENDDDSVETRIDDGDKPPERGILLAGKVLSLKNCPISEDNSMIFFKVLHVAGGDESTLFKCKTAVFTSRSAEHDTLIEWKNSSFKLEMIMPSLYGNDPKLTGELIFAIYRSGLRGNSVVGQCIFKLEDLYSNGSAIIDLNHGFEGRTLEGEYPIFDRNGGLVSADTELNLYLKAIWKSGMMKDNPNTMEDDLKSARSMNKSRVGGGSIVSGKKRDTFSVTSGATKSSRPKSAGSTPRTIVSAQSRKQCEEQMRIERDNMRHQKALGKLATLSVGSGTSKKDPPKDKTEEIAKANAVSAPVIKNSIGFSNAQIGAMTGKELKELNDKIKKENSEMEMENSALKSKLTKIKNNVKKMEFTLEKVLNELSAAEKEEMKSNPIKDEQKDGSRGEVLKLNKTATEKSTNLLRAGSKSDMIDTAIIAKNQDEQLERIMTSKSLTLEISESKDNEKVKTNILTDDEYDDHDFNDDDDDHNDIQLQIKKSIVTKSMTNQTVLKSSDSYIDFLLDDVPLESIDDLDLRDMMIEYRSLQELRRSLVNRILKAQELCQQAEEKSKKADEILDHVNYKIATMTSNRNDGMNKKENKDMDDVERIQNEIHNLKLQIFRDQYRYQSGSHCGSLTDALFELKSTEESLQLKFFDQQQLIENLRFERDQWTEKTNLFIRDNNKSIYSIRDSIMEMRLALLDLQHADLIDDMMKNIKEIDKMIIKHDLKVKEKILNDDDLSEEELNLSLEYR